MSNISLTNAQIEVIQKYLDGKTSMLGTPVEDMKTFFPVIDMAEKLMMETGEDVGDNLIVWFWNKYRSQENIE